MQEIIRITQQTQSSSDMGWFDYMNYALLFMSLMITMHLWWAFTYPDAPRLSVHTAIMALAAMMYARLGMMGTVLYAAAHTALVVSRTFG